MKVIVSGTEKHLSEVDILAHATGLSIEDCKMIITLSKRLQNAERDRDYWRDLAISTQQKLEAINNDSTRTTLA